MSGHSKWSQIKHKKAASDAKKSQLFSKILRLISIAVKNGGTDPSANPQLRLAIEKAKEINMPSDNIEKAIKKAGGALETENLEEVIYEAYGPAGTATIIEVITDNKNRTLNEIKQILNKYEAKIAAPGSALWAFEKQEGEWKPKHLITISNEDEKTKLNNLLGELENNEDVQNLITNYARTF